MYILGLLIAFILGGRVGVVGMALFVAGANADRRDSNK